ncbi:hypothetical protein HS088_TW12G00859 [Tripterygium wilfordii]|uniref:Uncharacterized protein n=1 Tax=Tripterygium wilfordii TaxID=458696 RepID=A0A7J7D015_TRIWF|nr:uncharacterized protein LOC120010319 [Tripterygium wilfordii]KAF5739650.1 hypothetical protein HS088_TW12G00859 [Tripterygium wilfordii]
MQESEKMEALKKAYAEIILNTSKEAAARVMLSERKALRFEQELRSAKNEGVRLLLRMKQMIDSKQMKIDELEAQLQEAEDVITDLRSELYGVRERWEKADSEQVPPMNGQFSKEDESSPRSPTTTPIVPSSDSLFDIMIASDLKDETLNPSILDSNCRNRNGCAQRIRAFEGNSLDGREPAPVMKNELIMKTSDKDDGKCVRPASMSKNMQTMVHLSTVGRKRGKARNLRTRTAQFGKGKAASCKSHPIRRLKPSQPPSIAIVCEMTNLNDNPNEKAFSIASTKTDNMATNRNSNGLETNLQCTSNCLRNEHDIFHEEKRKGEVQNRDNISTSIMSHPDPLSEICQPPSVLTRCKAYSFSLKGKVKSGEDQSNIKDNEVKIKPFPSLDPGLTLIKSDVDPISGSRNVTVSIKALNTSGVAQNASKKDSDIKDDSLVTGEGETLFINQEGDAAVNLAGPCSVSNSDVVNVPSTNSDLEDARASKPSDGSHSHADNNELRRYTRKRKKESLRSTDKISSPEETNIKRSVRDPKNGSRELEKSTLLTESSRDNRRLALVAHQLISLSGKRW